MKVHVVDLKNETIAAPVSVRAYLNQTITEFKQLIAQVCFRSLSLQTRIYHQQYDLIRSHVHESQNLIRDDILEASANKYSLCILKIKSLPKTTHLFSFIPVHFFVQATGLSAETMRVVLERCYNDLRLLYVPNKTLKAEGFFRSNKVSFSNHQSENCKLFIRSPLSASERMSCPDRRL